MLNTKSVMTIDLYTPAEVKQVREQLYKEQNGLCCITGLPVDFKDTHTEHNHDEHQFVRGAAHKSANMALGKLENLAVRYLYWYPHGLPVFLRQCADYIEKHNTTPDKRWRHVGWIKKVQTLFNKLNTKQQDYLLQCLDQPKGKNQVERKANFKKAVLSRQFKYERLYKLINEIRSSGEL